VRSMLRALLALASAWPLMACNPVVFSAEQRYEVFDVELMDTSGNTLGGIEAGLVTGAAITLDTSFALHLLHTYELSSKATLKTSFPVTPIPMTRELPYSEQGDWSQLDDQTLELTAADGTKATMVLEQKDGSRVHHVIPTAKFGVFLPPFDGLNGKQLKIRLKALPSPTG